ncbi:site-specific integrase [Polynucleobacter sp. Latsch14-2]|jgi:integrase|uniref:tyrosine-type recombinase/integrase n=1 Tax=Polynucleobacter sp. Latsch14-2 TaxID=2576920 RepID=UPI001BFE7C8C|nr:site-specific integrase [Polynucleobacter sp. Latsch14-2]MBT8582967.1 site-specific integrase [Polynucleobacter paneuropaeus]MBT8611603.1 site-specific integrase [Polynucleobacter paneuropaeus]MBU3613545.1 site-specific integrase [Polynucleobacter sp. Latsch14-2]
MATFRNRNGKWQARVQIKGHAVRSKTFINKVDAERWAKQIEVEMQKGSYTNLVLAERTTFSEIIERYITEVLPTMRGGTADYIRLKALARRPIAKLSMTALTPQKIAQHRDQRLKEIAPATVIRELSYFSSIITYARKEWGININNPVALVARPKNPQGRSRILDTAETYALFEALRPIGRRSIWMLPLVKLALETAMRRSELLGLRWEHIDLGRRTIFLQLTKNGTSRTVPLSTHAIQILTEMPRNLDGRVFPVTHEVVSQAFNRARKQAGVKDVRFHDLRHMAITRLAEKLPNLVELSAVSGHKSLAMLKRYYHPNAEKLAIKLG